MVAQSPNQRRSKIVFDERVHSEEHWSSSKQYGYRFNLLLEKGQETEFVRCNVPDCKKIRKIRKSVKDAMMGKLSCLKQFGGGLTLDFAKRQVDFIAVTAHFLDSNWVKNDFVALFSPLPIGMIKTSENVKIWQNDQIRLKAGFALKSPVQTRWLSYFNMVVAFLQNWDEARPFRLFRYLKSYVNVLGPIYEMVIEMQMEKESTSNRALEHLASIWIHLSRMQEEVEGSSLFSVALSRLVLSASKEK
uniref:Uncharacterized protein n=1 Tax=Ditylenchus dipsaci TaxID=166011 RepID=A0A915CYZ9_9BILA